ncbi:TPA: FAD-binding protein, partial [Candidatus Micrarchaeota archaeon]|nr:FAD-binding protein [Candidatus Micrarchaeota archaeon]
MHRLRHLRQGMPGERHLPEEGREGGGEMSKYDMIIIGAGPAGSTMARVAAQGGMNVLVVDKRKELGIPVRCGEGLGAREVVAQDLDIPKQCISTDIVGAKVIAPNGKS